MADQRVCCLERAEGVPSGTVDRLEASSTVEVVPVRQPESVADVDDRQAVLVGTEVPVNEIIVELEQLGIFDPVAAIVDDRSLEEVDADMAIHEQTARNCPDAAADLIESFVDAHAGGMLPTNRRLARVDRVLDALEACLEAVTDDRSLGHSATTVCQTLSSAGVYPAVAFYEYQPESESTTLRAFEGTDMSIDAEPFETSAVCQTAVTAVQDGQPTLLDAPDRPGEFLRQDAQLLLVPVVWRDVRYAVLGLYTERRRPFDTVERHVLSIFGRVLAMGLRSTRQKQALLHDETVTIELELENTGQFFVAVSDREDTWADLEGILIDDERGEARAFVRTAASEAAIEAQADATDWVDSVSIERVYEHERLVELAGSRVPIVEFMAEHGASLQSATATEGVGRVTFDVPGDIEVERLLSVIAGEDGRVDLLDRRDESDTDSGAEQFRTQLEQELTKRQHEVLLTAYHSGFFEWPRERTGEELADTLEIAQPTFHEHLRAAQLGLLDALLRDGQPSQGH